MQDWNSRSRTTRTPHLDGIPAADVQRSQRLGLAPTTNRVEASVTRIPPRLERLDIWREASTAIGRQSSDR